MAALRKVSKNVLVAGAVFIAVILIVAGSFRYPEPSGAFVASQQSDSHQNALFTYGILKYPAKAEVSVISGGNLTVGVATGSEELNFGTVPTGGSTGKRTITVTNPKDGAVKILLNAYGDIAPFLEFNKNEFMLNSGQSARVDIVFRTEKGMPAGNYTGEIDVIARQPKYGFLSFLN